MKIFNKMDNLFNKKALKSLYPTIIGAVLIISLFISHHTLAISTNPKTGTPMNQIRVEATAYSSTKNQTDGTPFIAASGKKVYDGIIAANFLPFGTKIKIPEIFGDKIFTVDDRMNQRYQDRIDIWYPTKASALKFGIKQVTIEVIGQ